MGLAILGADIKKSTTPPPPGAPTGVSAAAGNQQVTLTVRFLTSGLAGWERDSEVGVDGVAPLAPFTLILTDLAVAMLDAPTSVEM